MFGSEKRKERKEAKAEAKAERKEAKVQAKELKAEAKAERKEAKAAEKAERKARKSGDNAARTKIGMQSSRRTFRERMNVLMHRGAKLDDEFWDGLEEILIMSDIGARTSLGIVDNLREAARRKALPDGDAVNDLLIRQIAEAFPTAERDVFEDLPSLVLFVGINGSGKTTTVGKLAYEGTQEGHNVLLGSADTFRAAAIEQLEVWAQRANVEIVERERGSDPTPSSVRRLWVRTRCSSIRLAACIRPTT